MIIQSYRAVTLTQLPQRLKMSKNKYRCTASGHCDMQTQDIITKTKHFRWRSVFDDMRRMGRWSFLSWFDENRSIFDEEDMSRKRFSHCRSQWPWPLTSRPQICSRGWLSYSCPSLCLHKMRISTAFLLRENRRHATDRRTDRRTGAHNKWKRLLTWMSKMLIRIWYVCKCMNGAGYHSFSAALVHDCIHCAAKC